MDIRGNFEEWDLQVFPPLQDFIDRAKRAQLQVLAALARVPCLLDHHEVKPYRTMMEGYGLGYELPQGGGDEGDRTIELYLVLRRWKFDVTFAYTRQQEKLRVI